MKLEELRKKLIEEKYLKRWKHLPIKSNTNWSWSWNTDGSVDINGDICMWWYSNDKMFKLPFKFGKINGNFDCGATGLETLEGCPKEVTGIFACQFNHLKSLEFAPKKARIFHCFNNDINFTIKDVQKVCKVDYSNIVLT